MAEKALAQILTTLRTAQPSSFPRSASLLTQAKLHLCALSALTPTPSTPAHAIPLAREVYELGALLSIRALGHLSNLPPPTTSTTTTTATQKNLPETIALVRETFVRNIAQLRPFYELPTATLYPAGGAEARYKTTGLFLLFLLTDGRYAEFHAELELLTLREWAVETDRFLAYPVRLERWLMEGSYDRVWKMMKSREVPCEEYATFSDILTKQIRSEIASSSERAYPKLPISSTKSLLFLESEGAVVDFSRQRGWLVRDGEIFFPAAAALDDDEEQEGAVVVDADAAAGGGGGGLGGVGGQQQHVAMVAEKDVSRMVIENALGYARELETIV